MFTVEIESNSRATKPVQSGFRTALHFPLRVGLQWTAPRLRPMQRLIQQRRSSPTTTPCRPPMRPASSTWMAAVRRLKSSEGTQGRLSLSPACRLNLLPRHDGLDAPPRARGDFDLTPGCP